MSLSKFLKNAILTGCIESYCLVCEAYLKNEDDALLHTEKPVHKNNLSSTQYLDRYKEDHVLKVKNGYFCQFCNLLMPTATKVSLHVMETNHKKNKNNQLQRVGDSVIAFQGVSINEKAWNGFIDDTCILCGAEFTNEQIHQSGAQHTLNLVLSKLEFGADKTIYRKIDEDSFQCLTCNTLFPMTSDTSHFDSLEHKDLYEKCRVTSVETEKTSCDTVPKTNIANSKLSDATAKTKDVKKHDEDKEAKSQCVIVQPNDITIEITDLKEKSKKLEKSIQKPPTTNLSDDHYCNVLGAKDYIISDKDGGVLCILCDLVIESTDKYSHVNSKHHKTLRQMHLDHLSKKNVNSDPYVKLEDNQSDDKSKILDSLSRFQQNELTVDLVSETATCKKCMKNVDFNYDCLENHIGEHKIKNKKDLKANSKPAARRAEAATSARSRTPSNTKEELESYSKKNNFTVHGQNYFCKTCDTVVNPDLKQMKEHIASAAHKSNLSKKSEVKLSKFSPSCKQPLQEFVKSVTIFSNMFIREAVINDKYCINLFSFLTISKADFKLRCETCDMHLNIDQMEFHKDLPTHKTAVMEAPVLISLDTEFLREIKPGVFHCGFCNSVRKSWGDMEEHFDTVEHNESKTSAHWRLRQYLIDIRASNQRENMDMVMLMRMYMNGFNPSF